MSISNVCPTEDAVQVFLELLVDPMLPRKSIPETPDKPEAVAKQVHAVVLLYNYYHRKRHANLEFLDFQPFCKLALLLKPTLKPHLKLMLRTDDTEVIDLEKQLSLMEKAVKDACDISRIYASINVPSAKGLPVSKVSVLLIDKTKKNCILLYGSITQGVNSLIEKDVNESCSSSDGSIKAKQMSKRKRTPNKCLRDGLEANECSFQQLAFSAVKEATKDGISQSDLTIIESHVVCSLSKLKTATRFYIMQCAREAKARWIPIKDVIESLQGPLVKKNSSIWEPSPVVKYFHLLPYARIISRWYSRDVVPISFEEPEYVQEVINVNGFEMIEDLCEPEVQNNRNRNLFDGGIVEVSRNSSCAESEKKNEHCMNDFFDDTDGPSWTMDVDNHSTVHFEKKSTSETVAERVQHDSKLKKINSHAECKLNGRTDIAKFDVVNSAVQNNLNQLQDQIVTNGKAASNIRPGQDEISPYHTPIICESRSKFSAKLQKDIDSGIVEASRNSSYAESEKRIEKNEHCMNDFFDDIDDPSWTMDVGNHSTVHFEKKSTSETLAERVQRDSQLKKINSHAECKLNGRTDISKFDVVSSAVRNNLNQLQDQIVTNGKAASNIRPGQDGISTGNCTPIICESSSKFSAKLQKAIASKENILSETALRVLLSKRDKLVIQHRNIGDEIAQYDKKIQTILNGGEDDLELKIDLIIEGCNDASRENQVWASQGYEGPCSTQCKKRNRSPEETFSNANPCQELDGICKDKNWTLPTYQVFPSDGGYQAKVTVKGTDFESSSVGNACPKPHEARSSAASKLLAKLVDHV
ncbi:hypothetical protein HRI_003276800 [Hibiscus trionum]|uniref:DRBM domain-containing protein n=1 Tax=Hibiscus trionum TaxID=183268 RepID=A0A9W7IH05_HIBTR|nr:hypothetical protein HRI_003276800 [Hibiscus trionum]